VFFFCVEVVCLFRVEFVFVLVPESVLKCEEGGDVPEGDYFVGQAF
jgi:hypothetical protein